MPWEWPFGARVAAVLGFLLAASAVERLVRGPGAVRFGESVFLVTCGAAGAVFGVLVDLCTVSLSPDYFAVGKGLGVDPGLPGRALLLGLHAGTAAGVLAGCVLLAANGVGRRAPRRAAQELYARLPPLVACAVAGGVTGACLGAFLPETLLGDWRELVPGDARRSFLMVWTAHSGLYLGGAVGTLRAAWKVRKQIPEELDYNDAR